MAGCYHQPSVRKFSEVRIMKEIYIAPELELLKLAPAERLAQDLDFGDMMGEADDPVSRNPDTDIDIDLGGLGL